MLARTFSLPNHGKAVVDDARLETGSENEEGKRMVAKQLFSFFFFPMYGERDVFSSNGGVRTS